MGKRRSGKQRGRSTARKRALPNWPLLVPAALGMALALYLSLTAWFGSHALYCGEGSDCDLVQSSHWSTLLGLPIAFWGFLHYSVVCYVALRVKRADLHWAYAWIASLVGLGISLYLTAVSIFSIGATCTYCLGSLAIMASLFGVVIWQRPEEHPDWSWPSWLLQTGGATAAIVLSLQLHFSGYFDPATGPEDPYLSALAVHLSEVDARFYGASWCPHCREQKHFFGASAHRLPYIECSPGGRNEPPARACTIAGIRNFPTWIINGKHYSRILEPDVLALYTRFKWESPEPQTSSAEQ